MQASCRLPLKGGVILVMIEGEARPQRCVLAAAAPNRRISSLVPGRAALGPQLFAFATSSL